MRRLFLFVKRMNKMADNTALALNNLARHQMILRLLHDIRIDLEVCDLEGWDKMEYIRMLFKELHNMIKAYKGPEEWK